MSKRILLLSDTHGTCDDFIAKYAADADEIWHAGDVGSLQVLECLETKGPVRAVYGNIDGGILRQTLPEFTYWEDGGLKFLMLHIGGYPGRYSARARELIDRYRPDVFIAGHSHILKVMPDKVRHLMHMNPGAAGRSGFHKKRTMLRFHLEEGQLKDLEVIERDRKHG
ncbi:MAG: metallophosphoesterase family protein [Chlorobi bacterium]|nr:metallophosphoesterase family protein [Chlorobiota bacterium]